uniref:Uncharacterized protein n=1 Tax=Magallana gigas TaxID=29159 RepID=K1PEJ3_MAGGI
MFYGVTVGAIVGTHGFSIRYTAFNSESSVTDRKPVGSDNEKPFRKLRTMLGLAVFASLCYLASAHKPPPFVRDLDCPKYTVLQSFPEDSGSLRANLFPEGNMRGELDFLNGMKIPMIYPMLMTVYPEVGRNYEQSVMEMHFMIPHHMQPFPPAPTDPTVYITMLPPMDVYVKPNRQ